MYMYSLNKTVLKERRYHNLNNLSYYEIRFEILCINVEMHTVYEYHNIPPKFINTIIKVLFSFLHTF